jgi:hypothetical protein
MKSPLHSPSPAGLVRRTILVALACGLGLALTSRGATAQHAGGVRIGAIKIEASPYAAQIAPILLPALHQTFAAMLAPGDGRAAVLFVRIDSLTFTSYVDTFDPKSDVDWISGTGHLVGPGNHLLGEYPLSVNLPASYSGAWYLPDIDERRLDSLCQAFAQWLRRAVAN